MSDFKIIISPSKSFNKNVKTLKSGRRPKYLAKAKNIFEYIKKLSLEDTKKIYKLSDKKAKEVYKRNQEHGHNLVYAIELYGGLVFKQLDLKDVDKDWVDNHIIILDALYGIIKPYDLISPYRLDFKTNIGIDLKKEWQEIINKELKCFKIYNLASKEFSSLINHDLIDLALEKAQIKVARGKALNKIIHQKTI